jgi:hypothetical protein
LRNFSELVAKAFFLSEKLHFGKSSATQVLRNFVSFLRQHFSPKHRQTEVSKSTSFMNRRTNYSGFLIEVGFDKVFEQKRSFH